MIGPENIAAAIMRRWNASCRAVAPGGLWYGRVEEEAAAPYASLLISEENMERLSVGYILKFRVQVKVWGDNGPTGDVSELRQLLDTQMGRITLPATVGRILDVRSGASDLALEPTPRNANDVCLLSLDWSVKVQGS